MTDHFVIAPVRVIGTFYLARQQDPLRQDRVRVGPDAWVRVTRLAVPVPRTHDAAAHDALLDALDAATPRPDETVMNTHFLTGGPQ